MGQSQACLTGRLERLQPLCLVLRSGLGGGGMGWGALVEVWGWSSGRVLSFRWPGWSPGVGAESGAKRAARPRCLCPQHLPAWAGLGTGAWHW